MKFSQNSGNVMLSKAYEMPEQVINILKEFLPKVKRFIPIQMTFLSEDKEHIELTVFIPCPDGPVEVSDIITAASATEVLMDGVVQAIINATHIPKIFCQEEKEDETKNNQKQASIYMDATEGKGEIVRNALVECLGMSKEQATHVVFRIPGLLVKNAPMDKIDMFMKAMDQAGIAKYVRIKEPCLEHE